MDYTPDEWLVLHLQTKDRTWLLNACVERGIDVTPRKGNGTDKMSLITKLLEWHTDEWWKDKEPMDGKSRFEGPICKHCGRGPLTDHGPLGWGLDYIQLGPDAVPDDECTEWLCAVHTINYRHQPGPEWFAQEEAKAIESIRSATRCVTGDASA